MYFVNRNIYVHIYLYIHMHIYIHIYIQVGVIYTTERKLVLTSTNCRRTQTHTENASIFKPKLPDTSNTNHCHNVPPLIHMPFTSTSTKLVNNRPNSLPTHTIKQLPVPADLELHSTKPLALDVHLIFCHHSSTGGLLSL